MRRAISTVLAKENIAHATLITADDEPAKSD